MKARLAVIAVTAMFLAFSVAVMAQPVAEEDSAIVQTADFQKFLKFNIDKMTEELEKARKDKNEKKASCIEARLVDLKRILGETQANNTALREAAFEKQTEKIRQVFNDVRNDRDVAQQIVKLVNACYAQINEEGGFTETVEEFLGQQPITDEEEEGDVRRMNDPEPLPPEYEPEPISDSSEN